MARRVVETKAVSLDREVLRVVVIYEEGIKKSEIRDENPYTKRHHVLYQAGAGYEFK
ncbi:hypothetical protein [Schinkia azotoformans]|uniref:hypothetical protein n=1 Tax=Schinkia azotoformans TaxID=1454 RepID=UPI002DBE190B|nr:hypothetical protein [Schinkia azotoformans]MEC1714726.1 hypothetical protein [Schinkia azotoformans]MEC1757518.1 hypothetical protein [Schinkia azotoformans]